MVISPDRPVACRRNTVWDCDPKTNGDLWNCQTLTTRLLDECANQVDSILWWFDEQRKITERP